MTSSIRSKVLIYRNNLLERSETFIAAQAGALQNFEPVFCGLRRRSNDALPAAAQRCLLTQKEDLPAKLQRALFLHTGFAPRWLDSIRQTRARLMHAHFALDAASALPLVSQLKIPLIVSLHGYDVTSTDRALSQSRAGRIYLRRRHQLFARTSIFLCVSNFIRDKALEKGFPAEKLLVHSIGIDLASFQPSSSQPQENPHLLFVGRLVEKKGCTYLLKAMRIVQQKLPTAELTVIGEGPLRSGLEEEAAQLGLTNYRFLGAQPPEVVRRCMAQSRLFCVPSVSASNGDAEGLGMVFCEAQAMGVPVVSFYSGGIPEAVFDGKTGLLAPERDHRLLAQNLLTLLTQRELWLDLRAAGQKRMAALFDLTAQTASLERIYERVLMEHAGSIMQSV